MSADEGFFAQEGNVAAAAHDMQIDRVGGGDDDDARQQAFNLEDDINQRGSQAGPGAGGEGRQDGDLGARAGYDEHGADRSANGKGAIDGQIDEAQDAEGEEDADAGERVAQALPDGADVHVAQGHEDGDDDGQDNATRKETARCAETRFAAVVWRCRRGCHAQSLPEAWSIG